MCHSLGSRIQPPEGWTAVVSPDIEKLISRPAKTFLQFCREYIDLFREDYLRFCKASVILKFSIISLI